MSLLTLDLSAVGDDNWLTSGTRAAALAFHLADDVVALSHLAKDDVLAVKPLGLGGADEELGAVRVGARIGHGEGARAKVLASTTGETLIRELVTVDGLAPGAVAAGEIAALAHEAWDYAMELAALKVQRHTRAPDTFLATTKRTKVLGGLGYHVGEELHLHTTSRLAANGNVKEHNGVLRVDRVERDLRSSEEETATAPHFPALCGTLGDNTEKQEKTAEAAERERELCVLREAEERCVDACRDATEVGSPVLW